MINLLPPQEKENLRFEQVRKLVNILGMISFISLFCLFLIFLAIYFFIATDFELQQFSLNDAQESVKSGEFSKIKQSIEKYNVLIPEISAFYKGKFKFSDSLAQVYSIPRPEGISIISVSLQEDGEGKATKVSLAGSSSTRESLVKYKDSLLSQKQVKDLFFPPETWLNSKNINFNITFEFSENGQ